MSLRLLNRRQLDQVGFYRSRVNELNCVNSIKNFILVIVLTAGISFGIVGRLPLLVYGQTSSASSPSDNASGNGSMKKQTNGGAIDVTLQPSPEPIRHSGQTSLKVQFLTKGTEKVQPHIDYDVTIKDSSGKQVISATQLAGQAGKPLHTSERIV